MGIEKFKDIIVWQKAKGLTIKIYELFEESEDYRFNDQLLYASVSIMKNIAAILNLCIHFRPKYLKCYMV